MSVLAYRAVIDKENHFKKLIEESEKIPNSTWEEWLELQVIEKRARRQRLAARHIRIAKSVENLKLAVFAVFAMFFVFVATVFIL